MKVRQPNYVRNECHVVAYAKPHQLHGLIIDIIIITTTIIIIIMIIINCAGAHRLQELHLPPHYQGPPDMCIYIYICVYIYIYSNIYIYIYIYDM